MNKKFILEKSNICYNWSLINPEEKRTDILLNFLLPGLV